MAKKFLTDINIAGGVYDSSGDIGSSGQVLSSTGSGINWIDATSAASVVYQDDFTGNGSATAFTLANSIDNENKTQVYIDGVYQHKDNYSLNGTTLTFSTAPPNSSDIEVISFSSVSAADDILYDDDFASAGLMTTNGSGVYSITTNNSSNWNTAYTYSQVGHLPLAGGAITGAITTNSTFDGRDVSVDGAKLDGIEANATADQTDAEIRAAVEAATDSNVFTDADHTKLNAIEASADVTDTANVTAAGALMDSELTDLAGIKAVTISDLATETYVDTAVSDLVDSSPATLNTLNELAAALGDDPNFATTTANSIGTKLPLAGGTMTGTLTIADSGASDNPLILGSSSQTSYTLQQWQTSSHGTNEAYIIAYGAGHGSQAGNFAMKNIESGGDIFFELASGVEPLRLTSTSATFAGAATIEGGSLNLGKADTASGHINAYEAMTFNIDTDNDDTTRYFAWYNNGADGSGTELFKIEESGNATFAGDVYVNGGNLGVGTDTPDEGLHILDTSGAKIILNTNANTADSGIYMSEGANNNPTQNGAYVYYDATGNNFKIATGTTSLTDRLTIARDTGNATFTGNISAQDLLLPDGADIGWAGGYASSKPVLAANGTTMKMYPSGTTSGVQFSLSPTEAIFAGNIKANSGLIHLQNDAPILRATSDNNNSGFRIQVNGLDSNSDDLLRVQDVGTTKFNLKRDGDVANNWIPHTDSTYDLGSSSQKWANIYSGNISVTGNGGGNGQIDVLRTSGANVRIQSQSATGVVAVTTNHPLHLKTNDTTRLTIAAGGDATFTGSITGTTATFNTGVGDVGLGVYTSGESTAPNVRFGRNANEYIGFKVEDRANRIVFRQDETTGNHEAIFDIWSSTSNNKAFLFKASNNAGAASSTWLTIENGAATFAEGISTADGNLEINALDGGGSPAMTSQFTMKGYEGRGIGIKMKDNVHSASGSSDREWFVGSGYNTSNFNIGYSASGSQSSYPAQAMLNISTGGNVIATASLRAPIFYDTSDTAYYTNPAGDSVMNQIHINDYIRHNGDLDTYMGFNGSNSWKLHVGGGDRLIATTSQFTSNLNVAAPLYYDKDSTAHYIHPGNLSNLSGLNIQYGNIDLRYAHTVDMTGSGYNQSTYYPVRIYVSDITRIRIENRLNAGGTHPSWSTHGSGFSLLMDWHTNGSGWGTIGVTRTIRQWNELWANVTICGGITQMSNSSAEVVWLRGGGKYLIRTSFNNTVQVQTSAYTSNGQTVTPTTSTVNDVWSAASGSFSAGGAVYAGNSYATEFYDRDDTTYFGNFGSTGTSLKVKGTAEFSTSAGNLRGYIRATDTNDEHFIIATSGGEDIAFKDGGTSGGVNMIIRGDGDVLTTRNHYAKTFYDRDNSNYYINAASTSIINGLTMAGALQTSGSATIGSGGTSNIYMGGTSGNHFRFHTHAGATYFDMNSGTINWRQGSSTRYYFYPSTANMTINGTLTQNSDVRTKENIVEIPNALEKIDAMRGVYYNRTDLNTGVTKVGVIAQEVEAVLPELILEAPDTGLKSVAYAELTAILINGIKELEARVKELENK